MSYYMKYQINQQVRVPHLTQGVEPLTSVSCSLSSVTVVCGAGGGTRLWSPNRHFFFLISFPEINLGAVRKME